MGRTVSMQFGKPGAISGGSGGSGGSGESGVQYDLLWTNPSPTSSFGGQTITIDLSNYDLAMIVVAGDNTSSASMMNFFVRKGDSSRLYAFGGTTGSSYMNLFSRLATVNPDGVVFAAGYSHAFNANSSSSNNTHTIPIAIYGIKF